MEKIEYSKNWESIHTMSLQDINQLNLEQMDEEDLDALCYRLKDLGQDKKILSVYEVMLKSSLENPAVEYTNIFEKVIIHYFSKQNYNRAIELLYAYEVYDNRDRDGYQSHFIRRNLGIAYIFSGKSDKGQKIIDQLLNEEPGNYFNYKDIALEYFFKNDKESCYKYLQMGLNQAKKDGSSDWVEIFEERIETVSTI